MRVCITLGDPAGVGPEVVERAAAAFLSEATGVRLVLAGPSGIVQPIVGRLGQRAEAEVMNVFSGPQGRPSAESGKAALAALVRGIALAKSGAADALVTAPISKHALSLAGSADRGHTEILTRELAVGPTAMAFFSDKLRVVLATTHVPLSHAIESLSTMRVVDVAALLHRALVEYLGLKSPRLALAALNPHAGEVGLLGDEEQRVLIPAVGEAQARGISLEGPFAADTLFYRAVAGEFDGVVALYHDQALIPIKLLSFGQAVNVTLGLSVPRTSPDHGTAYDKVGLGTARADGMLSALRTAVSLVRARRRRRES